MNTCTKSFGMGLTSAEGLKRLECFKMNICTRSFNMGLATAE